MRKNYLVALAFLTALSVATTPAIATTVRADETVTEAGSESMVEENTQESVEVVETQDTELVRARSESVYNNFKYFIENGYAVITGLDNPTISTNINIEIPEKIAGYPVERIYYGAFKGNVSIKSVKLNEGLKTIESEAFSGCSNLAGNMVMPSTVNYVGRSSFEGTAIETLKFVVGENEVNIKDYAFKSCKSLTEVFISSNVKAIDYQSFYGDNNIEKLTIQEGGSDVAIGQEAFTNCGVSSLNIPSSVTSIGSYAFSQARNLESLTFNEGLKTIRSNAFADCNVLTGTITIPSTVTYIGQAAFENDDISKLDIKSGSEGLEIDSYVFKNCKNLAHIELNRVTSIGYEAFNLDEGIAEVTFPSTITAIGERAFADCTGLTKVNFNEGLVSIGSSAFSGANNLTGDMVIPSTVTGIGSSAFKQTAIDTLYVADGNAGIKIEYAAFNGCTTLKYAQLSNRLQEIGQYAFKDCNRLTWVQVKDGNYDLTIESRAFGGDKYLQAISLPKRTISIGYAAFDGDVKLKDVYYASTQKYYETYSDVNNGDSKNTAYLSAQMHYESSGPDEWPDTRYTGWVTVDGKNYWYEKDELQGTEGRGKEIYDPESDAWYWLDAVQGGAVATSKDVYQESWAGQWGDNGEYGKWVRYDKDGHMVKGWSTDKNGTYYFDVATGAMVKGYVEIDGKTYYFDKATGVQQPNGWNYERYNGSYYYFWYEDGVRQGYKVKEDGSIDESYRGKEIYDPESKAWYWLDNVNGGAKAVNKDVYQESAAGEWGDYEVDGVKMGKWVRYDANGHMVKGWNTKNGKKYYFDPVYGTMVKGDVVIDGVTYHFDVNTGVLQ